MAWMWGYLAAMGAFLIADGLWLGVVARSFYRERLSFVLSDQVDWLAAAIFYALYVGAALVLVVRPVLCTSSPWWHASASGALLGATAYATYDLTNRATIEGWPWSVVAVDVLWGASLTALVCTVGYFAVSRAQ